MEFKSFGKIENIKFLKMYITQKIHGTNAHVYIFKKDPENEESELDLICGSRNKHIFPGDDNFGFAAHVHNNKEAFLKLGEGYHYGEWAGPGINSGEGLKEKTFVLFDVGRYLEPENLPPQTKVVPLLYNGPINSDALKAVKEYLKANGSRLVEGFMGVEGIVVTIGGKRYKDVFEAEETQWKGVPKDKSNIVKKEAIDYSYLLQPIRLEKLLSKDESYMADYPKSLGLIVKAYIEDLVEEGQIVGTEDEIKSTRKSCTSQVFGFIKEFCLTYGDDF